MQNDWDETPFLDRRVVEISYIGDLFLPIIALYTTWVYRVLWGKVDEKEISDGSGHAY